MHLVVIKETTTTECIRENLRDWHNTLTYARATSTRTQLKPVKRLTWCLVQNKLLASLTIMIQVELITSRCWLGYWWLPGHQLDSVPSLAVCGQQKLSVITWVTQTSPGVHTWRVSQCHPSLAPMSHHSPKRVAAAVVAVQFQISSSLHLPARYLPWTQLARSSRSPDRRCDPINHTSPCFCPCYIKEKKKANISQTKALLQNVQRSWL